MVGIAREELCAFRPERALKLYVVFEVLVVEVYSQPQNVRTFLQVRRLARRGNPNPRERFPWPGPAPSWSAAGAHANRHPSAAP